MVVYIHREMERVKKIGCANNTMNGVINKRADNKRYGKKYVGFYNLLKKPFVLTQKSHVALKRKHNLTCYLLYNWRRKTSGFLNI